MKICNKKESTRFPPIEGDPMMGKVYQDIDTGALFIGAYGNILIALRSGSPWKVGGGFNGRQNRFRDVTNYVFIDTSELPPLNE